MPLLPLICPTASPEIFGICVKQVESGAEVELDKIPISPACRAYARAIRVSPIQLALTGGEDYELLFTTSPRDGKRGEVQARTRGYRITHIGTIRPQRFGIQMMTDGRTQPLPVTSYEHFC